jgi:hypothetical protein
MRPEEPARSPVKRSASWAKPTAFLDASIVDVTRPASYTGNCLWESAVPGMLYRTVHWVRAALGANLTRPRHSHRTTLAKRLAMSQSSRQRLIAVITIVLLAGMLLLGILLSSLALMS